MTLRNQKMGSVLPDSLVLIQGQPQALEAAGRRTLTDELERFPAAQLVRETADVLVERPEQRFVLRETFLTVFIHSPSVRQRSGVRPANIASRLSIFELARLVWGRAWP